VDSREELLAYLVEYVETKIALEEIGIFVDNVSYKVRFKPMISRGWTACEECRCFQENE
jgi:hypothetical protein